MEIGKLYQVKEDYWLLYPSKDIAAAAFAIDAAEDNVHEARIRADYWSKRLNCKVSVITKKGMFMLLEQTDRFCKVLSTEGSMGWIIYPEDEDSAGCFEEVKAE